MNTKVFKNKLSKIIDESGEFVTDTIEMKELITRAKNFGFDDILYVAGEDHNEVFTLSITKI